MVSIHISLIGRVVNSICILIGGVTILSSIKGGVIVTARVMASFSIKVDAIVTGSEGIAIFVIIKGVTDNGVIVICGVVIARCAIFIFNINVVFLFIVSDVDTALLSIKINLFSGAFHITCATARRTFPFNSIFLFTSFFLFTGVIFSNFVCVVICIINVIFSNGNTVSCIVIHCNAITCSDAGWKSTIQICVVAVIQRHAINRDATLSVARMRSTAMNAS